MGSHHSAVPRRTLRRTAAYADELNVYDAPGLIEEAYELARLSPTDDRLGLRGSVMGPLAGLSGDDHRGFGRPWHRAMSPEHRRRRHERAHP